MGRINTMRVIEEARGKINTRYDLDVGSLNDIRNSSENNFEMICNSFTFGYIQGLKAAKAEARKAARV